MKMPVFIVDENDVDIFKDKESLSSYMEVYDIQDNVAFDAEGQKLELKVSDEDPSIVIVEESAEPEYLPDILIGKIQVYLNYVDRSIDTKNLDLEDLVKISIDKIGYS